MHKLRLSALLGCALLVIFLSSSVARADELYGRIRGTVTDPSGGVVPGAKVTVTNMATGISRSMNSSSGGDFEFVSLLAPSVYDLEVEKSGFRKSEQTGIHLDVNQIYVANVTLEVGSPTQVVTVEANAVQVETTSMQLGTTVTANQMVDLPLNGRNWTQLQQLQPGVMASSDRFGTYSTNGAETQQNAYLINGLDTNDIPLNTPGFIPSPDAIGEFRMVTNTINPEFGRNSGAIINAVIKGGGNQFHGDGFDFYRDTFLNARNFFQATVAPFQQNQFGGTFGGPIKKEHAFFFGSYQGRRATEPQGFSVPTVYSNAERGGNFSDVGGFPAVNPATGATPISAFPLVGDDGTTYAAGSQYSTIFKDGYIPTADLDPLALKIMNQFVPPSNYTNNEYTFNPVETLLDDQFIYRVDENISAKDSIWFNGTWERHPSTETLGFDGADLPGFAETDGEHLQVYAAAWTHTFSPTTLNEARFSYFRFNFHAVFPTNTVDPTSYGFTGVIPQTTTATSLPIMSLLGMFTLGFSEFGPQPRIDQTYEAVDNFTKIAGNHTLKAGFTMERFEVFNPFYPFLSGGYFYDGVGGFSTSLPGADFLLGLPDEYVQGAGGVNNGRAREYYTYLQDQWKVKKNLTLTLGLGWDLESPYLDLYAGGEAEAAFRVGQQSTVFPTAPIGYVWPGDTGINKYGGPGYHYKDFGPRFGFAWSPRASTRWSVRGGVGLYYNRTEEEALLQSFLNPPFGIETVAVGAIGGTSNFEAPFTGYCLGATGPSACSVPQVFPFIPPTKGQSVDFTPYEPIGYDMNMFDQNYGVPRSANFNLGVDWQLSPSTTASVRYVGSQGRHEIGAYVLNNAGTSNLLNPTAAAAGCGSGAVMLYVAACAATFQYNPYVYGSPGLIVTDFNSNYNSLQVEFNRRLARGLQLQASYTWSRNFDETSNLENSAFNAPGIPPNFQGMYAPSANDAPQRLVINYAYTLPFYHFAHRWKRLTDDWTLHGITTLQHGFPINVLDSADTSLSCDPYISFYACPDRANVTSTAQAIGNPRNYTINGSPNYWLNPAAFSIPAPGTGIGNASRNPFYGPGINNWDISLVKDVHIDEVRFFQVRLETFNTFNHAQFGGPVNDVNNPLFGRVFGVQGGSTNGLGRVLQLGAKFYF